MDRGILNIKHIPLKVFYDNSIAGKSYILPSEQRNISIITGIKFGTFLNYINANNESDIKKWFNQYENKLKIHLNRMKTKLKPQELEKHCKHLNYILDFVVQAIYNLEDIKYVRLVHDFDTKNINLLNRYTKLNCKRDLHNTKDKYLYIKKIMHDLYDDILYMRMAEQHINRDQCSKMVDRIKNRRIILTAIQGSYSDEKIFNFDDEYTLPNIDKMLQGLKCTKTPEHPKRVLVTQSQPLTAKQSTGSDLLETRASEGGVAIVDLKRPESVSTGDVFELHEFEPTEETPPSEAEPNLKTTYAAASLAGVSLFGTILYKYTSFGSLLNPRRGARIRGNVFPLGNNVYDASIMNNFEYLQTGIPNGEYQLGYGSVTDY
ncbi:PIR protein [Plasmodium vivax]|nr:PIR protein [Plasmodium vivax]